jgi:thioredoxin-related protein
MRLWLMALLISNLFVGFAFAEEEDAEDGLVPAHLRLAASLDMVALGKLSRDKGVPILLMFSTEDCRYCKSLEADVLGPMRLAGADPQRVIIRKVLMDEYKTLQDFSGRKLNAENFGIYRGVDVVPTLQLVDASGTELVPKIVGYQTPDLYSAYLEEAIQVSQTLLKKK